MSTTTKAGRQAFWNWGVLIGAVLVWYALSLILSWYEQYILKISSLSDFSYSQLHLVQTTEFTFPALIAVLGYLLVRGERRTPWLVTLPFACIGVIMMPRIIVNALTPLTEFAVKMGYKNMDVIGMELAIALFVSCLWLLSYFVALGLCAGVNAGIRQWRSRYPT